MSVNFSIKNVPEPLADAVRARAERSRRSLQQELLVILEEAVGVPKSLTPSELLAELRAMGVSSPADSVAMVRADRDAR